MLFAVVVVNLAVVVCGVTNSCDIHHDHLVCGVPAKQYGDNDVLTSDTMVTHPVLQHGALSPPFCSSNDSVKPLLKDN